MDESTNPSIHYPSCVSLISTPLNSSHLIHVAGHVPVLVCLQACTSSEYTCTRVHSSTGRSLASYCNVPRYGISRYSYGFWQYRYRLHMNMDNHKPESHGIQQQWQQQLLYYSIIPAWCGVVYKNKNSLLVPGSMLPIDDDDDRNHESQIAGGLYTTYHTFNSLETESCCRCCMRVMSATVTSMTDSIILLFRNCASAKKRETEGRIRK